MLVIIDVEHGRPTNEAIELLIEAGWQIEVEA
jgi:hypothetical protein